VRRVPQAIVPSLTCLQARDHPSMFMWILGKLPDSCVPDLG
jgi:hypothetical protein